MYYLFPNIYTYYYFLKSLHAELLNISMISHNKIFVKKLIHF